MLRPPEKVRCRLKNSTARGLRAQRETPNPRESNHHRDHFHLTQHARFFVGFEMRRRRFAPLDHDAAVLHRRAICSQLCFELGAAQDSQFGQHFVERRLAVPIESSRAVAVRPASSCPCRRPLHRIARAGCRFGSGGFSNTWLCGEHPFLHRQLADRRHAAVLIVDRGDEFLGRDQTFVFQVQAKFHDTLQAMGGRTAGTEMRRGVLRKVTLAAAYHQSSIHPTSCRTPCARSAYKPQNRCNPVAARAVRWLPPPTRPRAAHASREKQRFSIVKLHRLGKR